MLEVTEEQFFKAVADATNDPMPRAMGNGESEWRTKYGDIWGRSAHDPNMCEKSRYWIVGQDQHAVPKP